MSGSIALVGAGPGSPELLTRRGARLLAAADVVLYDALVDPALLDLAPRARRIYVGKRRAHHAVSQAAIGRLLVRYARQGWAVVRLKAGDPFVFGRGGEELLAARAAGLACEVVPGISSAFAAPAAADIPVTHRGLSSGCLVLTATPAAAYEATLPLLAEAPLTIILLMALDGRARLAAFLLAHGWAPDHPAAIVCGATTPDQWSWTGRLAELAHVDGMPLGAPGVVILGRSIEVAQAARAVERAPLVAGEMK